MTKQKYFPVYETTEGVIIGLPSFTDRARAEQAAKDISELFPRHRFFVIESGVAPGDKVYFIRGEDTKIVPVTGMKVTRVATNTSATCMQSGFKKEEENNMFSVGDTVYHNNKAVRVIAKLNDEEYVCRFVEDIQGKHPNRCYIYTVDQLRRVAATLEGHFVLSLFNGQAELVNNIDFDKYPSAAAIEKALLLNKAVRATVSKDYTIMWR